MERGRVWIALGGVVLTFGSLAAATAVASKLNKESEAIVAAGGDAPGWTSDTWPVLLFAVTTFLGVIVMGGGGGEVERPLRGARGSERADEARDHLNAASGLLDELRDELAVRIRLLEQRQGDAEHYEQLASLNADQAKAIEGLVRRQFDRQSRMTWLQFGTSLVAAFILGLVVNWLSQPILAWLSGS